MLSQEAGTPGGAGLAWSSAPCSPLLRMAPKPTSLVPGIVSFLVSHQFPVLFKVETPEIFSGGLNFLDLFVSS